MHLERWLLVAALAACDSGGGSSTTPDAGARLDGGAGGAGGGAGGAGGGAGGVGGGAGGVGGGAGGVGGGAGGEGGEGGSVERPRFTARHANLRFKSADRLSADLARALELPEAELCAELGRPDCIERIHKVPLGGVEAYKANIYQPFPEPSVTAPLIVERVALAACTRRIILDAVTNPAEAKIFGAVPLNGTRLANVDGPEVTRVLTTLYHRALLREPTAEELTDLRQLNRDLEAAHLEGNTALMWAQGACVAVLTSTEFLFY